MKKQGFTLWELLAVIIIILIVVAILFPVFAKSRRGDEHWPCISREKQVGLAILVYAQDYDEDMPNIADAKNPDFTWRSMIYSYAKSKTIFLCPDRKPIRIDTDGFPESYAANYTGNYSGGRNDQGQGVFAGPGSKPVNVNDIEHPESLITLCEVWHTRRPDFNIDNLGALNPTSDMLWAGHGDGGNCLFADGHAKWLKPLDTKGYWHRDSSIPLSAGAMDVLKNAHLENGK